MPVSSLLLFKVILTNNLYQYIKRSANYNTKSAINLDSLNF